MLTVLFSVTLPANTQIFMFSMMRLSNFDVYNTEDALHSIFHLSETKPFNAIFDQAGYQTSNFIIESGTLLFLIAGIFALLVLRLLIILALHKMRGNWFTNRLRRRIDLNVSFVRYMLESCLCLGLVAGISLLDEQSYTNDKFADKVSMLLAILQLIVLILTTLYIAYAAIKFFPIYKNKEE